MLCAVRYDVAMERLIRTGFVRDCQAGLIAWACVSMAVGRSASMALGRSAPISGSHTASMAVGRSASMALSRSAPISGSRTASMAVGRSTIAIISVCRSVGSPTTALQHILRCGATYVDATHRQHCNGCEWAFVGAASSPICRGGSAIDRHGSAFAWSGCR